MNADCHHIVDANINRFKEGARVLEDIARFVLKDLTLFAEIKNLKQQIIHRGKPIQYVEDIGGATFEEDNNRNSLLELVQANAARMQEAARVLEEIDDAKQFKKIRFASYELHQIILKKLAEFRLVTQLKGLYPICCPDILSIPEMASIINQTSVSICQLRMKKANKQALYQAASQFKSLLNENVLLIINDHLDVAMLCADGVHLGQNDMPPDKIRQQASEQFILGITCHNVKEALNAESSGCSYISLGCLFTTNTKKETTSIDLHTAQEISSLSQVPVCVIGGINIDNITTAQMTQADMLAVCEAIWSHDDALGVCHKIQERLT